MSIVKSIYEHLKTRKKYNDLKLNYTKLQGEYDNKVIELYEEKRTNKVLRDSFESNVNKLVEENIDLQKQIKELKRKMRDEKKSTKPTI